MQDLEVLGERALLFAMIERAALDATGNGGFSGGALPIGTRRTARAWITYWENAENSEPFTFPWVCIHLDLDPYEMRSKLQALYRNKNTSLKRSSYEWKVTLERMCATTVEDSEVYY